MLIGLLIYKKFSAAENFAVIRKRGKGKIKIGIPSGAPGIITDLLKALNVTGGQLNADAKYDTVNTDLLDKENIH